MTNKEILLNGEIVTRIHQRNVQNLLSEFAIELLQRGAVHDDSKLSEEEYESFAVASSNLKNMEYGTPEYKEGTKQLGKALEHHYANNTHHPEHYFNGVNSMDLFDICEMVCDWIDASRRGGDNGTCKLSLVCEKFEIDGQLKSILAHTIVKLGGHYK